MINWYLVAFGPLGVLIGTEIARRKNMASGTVLTFQPLGVYRLVMTAIAAGVFLFVEAAGAALSEPTPFHLWTLILSAGAVQLALVISCGNEVRYANASMSSVSNERAVP